MVQILLVQPPIRDFYLTTKRTYPYGLACIASVLIRDGFSVKILDCLSSQKSRIIPLPEDMSYLREYYGRPDVSPFGLFHHFRHFGFSLEHVEKVAKASGAFLVGISSLFTPYSDEAIDTAKAIKRSLPYCKIVLGGHHATAMPKEALQCSAVDFVIRGDGELAMSNLARALRDGTSIDSIEGVVFRSSDGTTKEGSPPSFINLDDLPLPAFHLVDQKFYSRGRRRSAVICASRGCPLKCSYCSLGASSETVYRRRTVESVLKELELCVVDENVNFIDFEDENISMEKQWFLELLQGIKERFHLHRLELRAMNGLFPPSLDEETVQNMAMAGFRVLNLSLGSFSKKQLQRFNRPDVIDAFDRCLLWAEKHLLKAVGYVLIGAPGQNALESMKDLLHFAERKVLAGVSVFYPAPGSRDYSKCKAAGLLPTSYRLMRGTALPISHTTTRDECITLLRLGRLLNFIKSAIDLDIRMPKPRPLIVSSLPTADRTEAGLTLLEAFLHDGVIRGIQPDGNIFEHKTSEAIARRFRDELLNIEIKGT